jgi:putative integral membrane protein (TIGR02587 family)
MRAKNTVQSLQEYGRGVIGGLLFSLPMLYTMEIWWTSFTVSPWLLLLYMLVTFVSLLGYNTYAGLRASATWKEIAVDSIEELGLGLVLGFLFLWLLGVLQPTDMSLERMVYMTVVEAMPIAIGVSIGTAQLGTTGEDEEEDESEEKKPQESILAKQDDGPSSTMEQIALAICASLLFGANVAPTEEVMKISTDASPLQLLLVFLVSLALSAAILFYIGFRGSYETPANKAPTFLEVIWGLSITYATSFCTSAGALWFFGRFDGVGLQPCVEATVVLGLVSALGASAGRFLFDQEYK